MCTTTHQILVYIAHDRVNWNACATRYINAHAQPLAKHRRSRIDAPNSGTFRFVSSPRVVQFTRRASLRCIIVGSVYDTVNAYTTYTYVIYKYDCFYSHKWLRVARSKHIASVLICWDVCMHGLFTHAQCMAPRLKLAHFTHLKEHTFSEKFAYLEGTT